MILENIIFLGIDVETGRRVIEGTGSPDITAHSIHRALYRHKLDVKSVMHTHPTYATVLSVLQVKLFCFFPFFNDYFIEVSSEGVNSHFSLQKISIRRGFRILHASMVERLYKSS